MFEKIKTFFVGFFTAIISFITLYLFRKRKDVSNNRIGVDTTGNKQSGIDELSTNTKDTTDRIEFTVEDFGITNNKLEYIAKSNNRILQSIKKRQSNNQNN